MIDFCPLGVQNPLERNTLRQPTKIIKNREMEFCQREGNVRDTGSGEGGADKCGSLPHREGRKGLSDTV